MYQCKYCLVWVCFVVCISILEIVIIFIINLYAWRPAVVLIFLRMVRNELHMIKRRKVAFVPVETDLLVPLNI